MASAVSSDGRRLRRISSSELLPPDMSELSVVLLGNSWSDRSSTVDLLLGRTGFNPEEEPDVCQRISGSQIAVINTPDLLDPHVSPESLTKHVDDCLKLSLPGPRVFLLVLQPEEFTEE
ncbi:GTPase IMAP family member 9-like [Aulostomus maculatus]